MKVSYIQKSRSNELSLEDKGKVIDLINLKKKYGRFRFITSPCEEIDDFDKYLKDQIAELNNITIVEEVNNDSDLEI